MSKKQAIAELLNRKTSPLSANTSIQVNVNTEDHQYSSESFEGTNQKNMMNEKKKATFELDLTLHKRLKMFSVKEGKSMVQVVEEALTMYLPDKDI